MRILLDGEYHTNGAIEDAYEDFLVGDPENEVEPQPDFDASRLGYHPDDLRAKAGQARSAALTSIDDLHAKALVALCGQATVEERDTWPVKLAAAEAVLAGSASETQEQMLAAEAGGKQVSLEALAQVIVYRAGLYQRVVGIAAKLRADGKRSLEGVEAADLPVALKEIERKAAIYIAEEAHKMAAEAAGSE